MSDWRIDNDMNMYLKGLEDGKDRNKQEIEKLEQQLQQKENIIKEVREIFKYYGTKEDIVGYSNYTITGEDLIKLLEILDGMKGD